MDHCDENADCYDVTGSYGCSCHSGFRGDGFNCTGKYEVVVKIITNIKVKVCEFFGCD